MKASTRLTIATAALSLAVSGLAAPSAQAQMTRAQGGSSDASACLALAGSSLGAIALSSQHHIPFVADAQASIDSAIKNANTAIQQGVGIHNEQAAAAAEQSSQQITGIARQAGPIAGGLSAAALVLHACAQPDDSSSGDDHQETR